LSSTADVGGVVVLGEQDEVGSVLPVDVDELRAGEAVVAAVELHRLREPVARRREVAGAVVEQQADGRPQVGEEDVDVVVAVDVGGGA
jgi:hypothetical protein